MSAATRTDPEAVYAYEDEDETTLFEVVRFPGKKFMQRRPDGRWGLDGTRRVLYRLPQLIAHIESNSAAPIYICEGEKDVHAIERAGGVATCNPMGAGKWTDAYSEQLQGARRIVIVADNDPTQDDGRNIGFDHAITIVRSLGTVGLTADVTYARSGKDAADHLAAGHTLDDFLKDASPLDFDSTLTDPESKTGSLVGLTHEEVLSLDFAEERHLIRGLIPTGAVGTIAGVPETHKSWLAQAIAVRCAEGKKTVLGCEIIGPVNVGYFWQDDSTREEAERVKLFHAAHDSPASLPLYWFLNKGVALPDDIGQLRLTVDELNLDLAVLDSFYNFLPGVDLKDVGAEQIVALLKKEICDPTGCTVLIVDHMPWPNDTNRQRLRAYGGVFKNAATRFGIYIDAQGKNLSIEARGNNIRGFKKSPAYWDEDALELRLLEQTDHDEKVEERATAVLEYLETNTGSHSKTAVRIAVGGRAEITDQALELLKSRDRVINLSEHHGTAPDGTAKAKGWIATIHADKPLFQTLSLLAGTAPDSETVGHSTTTPVPPPIGGQGMSGQAQDGPELDDDDRRMLALYAQEPEPPPGDLHDPTDDPPS